jgi:hypothetical protein
MHSVKKIWRWSCKGQFATPGAKSEEPLFPSKGVIGEIKMASILQTPCPDTPTCGLQVAYRRLTPGIEERQSKCDRWKKGRRGLYEVSQQRRKDVL